MARPKLYAWDKALRLWRGNLRRQLPAEGLTVGDACVLRELGKPPNCSGAAFPKHIALVARGSRGPFTAAHPWLLTLTAA